MISVDSNENADLCDVRDFSFSKSFKIADIYTPSFLFYIRLNNEVFV